MNQRKRNDLDRFITGNYGERQFDGEDEIEPGHYHCLACGRTVEMAEGDEFPRDNEHCSHQWEKTTP